MSKLMSDLNSLNQTRKGDGGVVIEEIQKTQETQEIQEQPRTVSEYKGIYFLGFLMILLIGFSVMAMSVSLKTFSQLEAFWADSKKPLEILKKQQNDIGALRSLIADGAAEELAHMEDVKVQINELKIAVNDREVKLSEINVAYNDLNTAMQASIDELKLSEQLMLEKLILINDQVQKISKEDLLILNTN